MVKAFSYIRWSSGKQTSGQTLDRQQANRDAWLARHPDVTLDTSMRMIDEAASAWKAGNVDDRECLAEFLAQVRGKRIEKGSYLIVESLDRLTRDEMIPALSLVLSILEAGIQIVQLSPAETIYHRKSEPMQLMMMLMELSRGHGESQRKSELVRPAWKAKKKLARERNRPLTKNLPSWLILDGEATKGMPAGTIKMDDDKKRIIKRIFALAANGLGSMAIAKKLNAENVPVIIATGKRKGGFWKRSYVTKLLSNRQVLGEYQPYEWINGRKQPDGAPIKGYFPAAITDDEWHCARAGREERRNKSGRESTSRINVFQGLLYEALTGIKLHAHDKRGDGRPVLIPYNVEHFDKARTSFPVETLESCLLKGIKELDPRDILPDAPVDNSGVLTGKLKEVDARIAKLKSKLLGDDDLDPVVDAIRELTTTKKALEVQIQEELQRQATPLSSAWDEVNNLLALSKRGKEWRLKLRSIFRRIIDRINCWFTSKGRVRLAVIEIVFVRSRRREFMVYHRPAYVGRGPRRESSSGFQTMPYEKGAPGIRNLYDAVKTEWHRNVMQERVEEWLERMEEAKTEVASL